MISAETGWGLQSRPAASGSGNGADLTHTGQPQQRGQRQRGGGDSPYRPAEKLRDRSRAGPPAEPRPPAHAKVAETVPGSLHCRPGGGGRPRSGGRPAGRPEPHHSSRQPQHRSPVDDEHHRRGNIDRWRRRARTGTARRGCHHRQLGRRVDLDQVATVRMATGHRGQRVGCRSRPRRPPRCRPARGSRGKLPPPPPPRDQIDPAAAGSGRKPTEHGHSRARPATRPPAARSRGHRRQQDRQQRRRRVTDRPVSGAAPVRLTQSRTAVSTGAAAEQRSTTTSATTISAAAIVIRIRTPDGSSGPTAAAEPRRGSRQGHRRQRGRHHQSGSAAFSSTPRDQPSTALRLRAVLRHDSGEDSGSRPRAGGSMYRLTAGPRENGDRGHQRPAAARQHSNAAPSGEHGVDDRAAERSRTVANRRSTTATIVPPTSRSGQRHRRGATRGGPASRSPDDA